MIINIHPGTFGGPMRNGDMIATTNVIEHFRKNDPTVKFHMLPGSISSEDYCIKFFNYLLQTTDYFSLEKGQSTLGWNSVNLWDFRDIIGDNVKLKNDAPKKHKICIFPVLDAPYNVYRNWPIEVLQKYIDKYSDPWYDSYERILCAKNMPPVNIGKFTFSSDFMENIHHILDCEIFVGGDTGTSHFAWSLDRGPDQLIYANSSRGLVHTLPFYLIQGKGEMETYWLNVDGANFQHIHKNV